MPGLLEERWLHFDDSKGKGTIWVNELGVKIKLRKCGLLSASKVWKDRFVTLLPEYYLRPYVPKYITEKELNEEIRNIKSTLKVIK